VRRFTILAGKLSIEAGEVTDKGSINQRAFIRNRPALIETLYAEDPPESVIVVG